MQVLCPEDTDWDATLRSQHAVRWKCGTCGATYYEIDNMGAWQCTMRWYDPNRNAFISIPADHGGPYSEHDDKMIPSYAQRFYNDTNASAIIYRGDADAASGDIINTFSYGVYRRYDYRQLVRQRLDYPLHGYKAPDPYMRK